LANDSAWWLRKPPTSIPVNPDSNDRAIIRGEKPMCGYLLSNDLLPPPIRFRMPAFARPGDDADQAYFGRAALAARELIIELSTALRAAASFSFELKLRSRASTNHGILLRADEHT
jgi:hypothetical protein